MIIFLLLMLTDEQIAKRVKDAMYRAESIKQTKETIKKSSEKKCIKNLEETVDKLKNQRRNNMLVPSMIMPVVMPILTIMNPVGYYMGCDDD